MLIIVVSSLEEEVLTLGVDVGDATKGSLVDAAVTFLDFEVTALSPAGSPRVGTDPVLGGSLNTPTNDFDGMASLDTT